MNILYNKFIFFIFFTLNLLFSVSAPPFPFEVEQSDGSKILVHMFGHEYYNWMETEDGYVIDYIEDEMRKGWYYSQLDENGMFTASEILVSYPAPLQIDIPKYLREINPGLRKSNFEKSILLRSSLSSLSRSLPISQIKPLVFLVDFSDVEHLYTSDDFNQLLFSEDLSQISDFPEGHGGHENYNMSVRDYYEEISNGEFDISGNISSIVNWHQVENNHNYYTF